MQSGQIVLHPERAHQLPVAHPQDVDLIDTGEAPPGRRVTQPFAPVGAGAPEMRGHLVTFGDEVDDLDPEVGERFPEGPDPLR